MNFLEPRRQGMPNSQADPQTLFRLIFPNQGLPAQGHKYTHILYICIFSSCGLSLYLPEKTGSVTRVACTGAMLGNFY